MLLMKVVFNFPRSRRLAQAIGTALVLLSLLWANLASAQTAYYTPRTILSEFFPRSQAVTFQRFDLTAEQRERLTAVLGYTPRKPSYTIYIAKTADKTDGYAIIDEEKGQHLPITFAVKFSAAGVVERQELMVYRERYGDEIRDPRFRQQFVGKTAKSPIREGEEIIAVSGATISSRAMVIGVRRVLVLLDELVLKPAARQPAGVAAKAIPAS
jgi:electron transport complex protein RnfG